jgi:hypothetical protein
VIVVENQGLGIRPKSLAAPPRITTTKPINTPLLVNS